MKEELNALKEEAKPMIKELKLLSEDELNKVAGGNDVPSENPNADPILAPLRAKTESVFNGSEQGIGSGGGGGAGGAGGGSGAAMSK